MNILFCYDSEKAIRETYPLYLRSLGIVAKLCETPPEILEEINHGLSDIDAVLIHLNFGNGVYGVDMEYITHKLIETAGHVRIIAVGGNYPDGKDYVAKMQLDSYCSVLNLRSDWMIDEINKGSISPEEALNRGLSINTPDGKYFRQFNSYGPEYGGFDNSLW